MKPEVLVPLIFSVLFLLADAIMLVKMIRMAKKYENKTVEELGKKLNPYLYATCILSVLLAVCMILIVIFR